MAVNYDGNFVVTPSRDKSAKLWEFATGRELRSFMGHQFTMNGIESSQDGKYLATSNADNTANVWEVISGKEFFLIKEKVVWSFDQSSEQNAKELPDLKHGLFLM